MPKSTQRKRKSGFTTKDILKESYRYPGEGIKVNARPVANYSIPKPKDGDSDALVRTLDNITKIIPQIQEEVEGSGMRAFIKGEDRPDEYGFFSNEEQAGWDTMSGKADEGKLYSSIDEGLQELTASFTGEKPNDFLESVDDMLSDKIDEITKDKSPKYIEGIAAGIIQAKKDTALASQGIVNDKLKVLGTERVKAITESRLRYIYSHPSLSTEQKAVRGRSVMTQLQEEARVNFNMNRDEVNAAMLDVLGPIAIEKSPNLLDLFEVQDATGIQPKNTAGGQGAQEAIYKAKVAQDDRLPFEVYQSLKGTPAMQNADGTPNFFAMSEFVTDPDNWEVSGIEDGEQAKEVIAFLQSSWNRHNAGIAQVKKKNTVAGLNAAFEVKLSKKPGSTDKAVKMVRDNPHIDGQIKDRVINGMLNDLKVTDQLLFNQALDDIFRKKITDESTIYAMFGNGVTATDGNKLINFFNKIHKPENSRLKREVFAVKDSLTKGGLTLAGHSTAVQHGVADAVFEIMDAAEEAKKEGKPFDWSLPEKIGRSHQLNIDEKIKAHTDSLNLTKKAVDRTQKYIDKGEFITVGSGADQFYASPGIKDVRTFMIDINKRKGKRNDNDYIDELMLNPDIMLEVNKLFMLYSQADQAYVAEQKAKTESFYKTNTLGDEFIPK